MQLSSRFVSLAFSLVLAFGSVSAAPVASYDVPLTSLSERAPSQSMGAAYFITNEPDGNFVIAANIGSDGKLQLKRAIKTFGLGAHGQADGPDALFSQGAIKASGNGKVLATVNPGSNTLSAFAVDSADPTVLKMLGAPVSSEGEFPVSLTLTKAGDRACVLNGGAVASVNCYRVDSTKGLVALPDTLRALELNQTTPATGPPKTASHVLFSEDEKKLIASVKGAPDAPGFVAVWDIAQDGTLSKEFTSVAPPQGGALPFGMSLIPGTTAAVVTDPGVGFDVIDFDTANSAAASKRSSAVKVDGQGAVCWSSHSTKTGNHYMTDIVTALVTEVSVDKDLKPKIVKQYQQKKGSATIDTAIASVGDNDFLYILASNATEVQVMALNAPGQAKTIQTIDIAGPLKNSGLKVNAANLQGMTVAMRD